MNDYEVRCAVVSDEDFTEVGLELYNWIRGHHGVTIWDITFQRSEYTEMVLFSFSIYYSEE